MPTPLCSLKIGIFSMFAFVFSCATKSIVAGNSTLPLTWSPCVCVLIKVVTGFGVSSLILSRIGLPQPGFLASTTTTPFAVTNTAVLPPPPRSTNRLSLTFSTSIDLRRVRRRRLRLDGHQRAERQQHAQHDPSFHEMPPGKKTRWMNQNAPAAMTTTEPAKASCRPADWLRDRSAASAVATTATTSS